MLSTQGSASQGLMANNKSPQSINELAEVKAYTLTLLVASEALVEGDKLPLPWGIARADQTAAPIHAPTLA